MLILWVKFCSRSNWPCDEASHLPRGVGNLTKEGFYGENRKMHFLFRAKKKKGVLQLAHITCWRITHVLKTLLCGSSEISRLCAITACWSWTKDSWRLTWPISFHSDKEISRQINVFFSSRKEIRSYLPPNHKTNHSHLLHEAVRKAASSLRHLLLAFRFCRRIAQRSAERAILFCVSPVRARLLQRGPIFKSLRLRQFLSSACEYGKTKVHASINIPLYVLI